MYKFGGIVSSPVDFLSFKRELSTDAAEIAHKKLKVEENREFKYKSNKMQYEFNQSISDKADRALELLEDRSIRKVKKKVEQIKSILNIFVSCKTDSIQ